MFFSESGNPIQEPFLLYMKNNFCCKGNGCKILCVHTMRIFLKMTYYLLVFYGGLKKVKVQVLLWFLYKDM